MNTSQGSLFQCLTTLTVKKFFLMSSPNLPWSSFVPFSHILSLVTREKRSAPPSPFPFLTGKLAKDAFNSCILIIDNNVEQDRP